jgi:hypothetical protein
MKDMWKKGSFRKQVFFGVILTAGLSMVAGSAIAADPSADVTVTAEISQSITVTPDDTQPIGGEVMIFPGKDYSTALTGPIFILDASSGAVDSTTNILADASTDALYSDAQLITPTSGVVTIEAGTGVDFTVTLTDGAASYNLSSASNTAVISDMTTYSTSAGAAIAVVGGTPTIINVGAKVVFPEDVAAGETYTGSVTLNLAYN